MKEAGLRMKTLILTAKQKICPIAHDACDMEVCEYAESYFTKRRKAMEELIRHDIFDGPLISEIGEQYQICPFEFSLDLSESCDLIICDLNYVFDPRVFLKRYFEQESGKFAFLIDEAHNLPDRLRSMYSSRLNRSDVLDAQAMTRNEAPKISDALGSVNRAMVRLKKAHITGSKRDPVQGADLPDLPETLLEKLDEFLDPADLWLERHPDSPIRREFMAFYFEVNNFLTTARLFSGNYRFMIEAAPKEIGFTLFCIDPSPIFSSLIKRGRSAIFFSATFYPRSFYQALLFGNAIEPYTIVLPSPFSEKNLKVVIRRDIETTLRQRHRFHSRVADAVTETIRSRKGNYLVFFPSYDYLERVRQALEESGLNLDLKVQHPMMSEDERQDFIEAFQPGEQLVGLAVMGGIFGEGIDLEGERLIGVIVVGVGLPQICMEQERIRTYHDEKSRDGFFNAYQMPGFNRVLQAAGRLIRTETDKGVVVLLDSRFTRPDYQSLFPDEWHPVTVLGDGRQMGKILRQFWEDV